MRKLIILNLLLIFSALAYGQKPAKLFINFGSGPSYSLFYSSGGWVRNFGSANLDNVTAERTALAFSHFAEFGWRLKNDRWSLRAGYSMHHFFPKFKRSGVTANGTFYEIDTREADRCTYFQPTINYAILDGKNRLEVGTGLYIQVNRRQDIEYFDYVYTGNSAGSMFIIKDYVSSEAGFPFNLDYLRTLKNGNGIGCRFNFNYTQSVQTPEHLALQIFFQAKLK